MENASEIGQKSNGLSIGSGWVTGQNGTRMGRLDATESLQLLWFDANPCTEANLAGSPLDKGHTVGVQRLVDRGGTRSSLDQGDTGGFEDSLGGGSTIAALAEVLDDGSLHSKLDEIEREEPDDVLKKSSTMYWGGERER